MADKDLQKLLEQLRLEIEASGRLDAASRAKLEQLEHAIHQQLAEADSEVSESAPGLSGSIQKTIDDFEESHPTLTLVLGRVMDVLNKMGI